MNEVVETAIAIGGIAVNIIGLWGLVRIYTGAPVLELHVQHLNDEQALARANDNMRRLENNLEAARNVISRIGFDLQKALGKEGEGRVDAWDEVLEEVERMNAAKKKALRRGRWTAKIEA